MRVETLAVGTEMLLGDLVNTNAAWLGQELAAAGFDVIAGGVVGDNVERIHAFMAAALARSPALVVTGGLGPTQDDVTRDALAALAGVPLRRDDTVVDALRARYEAAGRRMPDLNLRQADVPEGATVLPNDRGSAPGLRLEVDDGVVYLLPGVPHEMEAMFSAHVLPDLLARSGGASAIVSRTLRTVGLWESAVAEMLADIDDRLGRERAERRDAPTIAYLAGSGEVRVRFTAKAATAEAARASIAPVEAEVRAILGPAVYGADGDTLDGRVHELLGERGETVAVAESLTGGGLGARLTARPGASLTFRGGITAYATELKHGLLGVDAGVLERDGPVAASTAAAMARGARDRLGATYGLALTGVAGPDDQDGVAPGTVYAALATPATEIVRELRLTGDRDRIRMHATVAGLDLLRRWLAGVLPEQAG